MFLVAVTVGPGNQVAVRIRVHTRLAGGQGRAGGTIHLEHTQVIFIVRFIKHAYLNEISI